MSLWWVLYTAVHFQLSFDLKMWSVYFHPLAAKTTLSYLAQ